MSPATIVSFSKMLIDLGFEVTFCPYRMADWWQACMNTLWSDNYKVSWWNLQCFDGGVDNRNDLKTWIESLATATYTSPATAASFLMPGLAVKGAASGQCPRGAGSIEETFSGWRGLGLRGGFLWNYDVINEYFDKSPCGTQPADLLSYVEAVNDGLKTTS